MLRINRILAIPDEEIEISAVRAGGPGGQNVNKVASAIHLRFDVAASSLPDVCKRRLLALRDHRISSGGVIVIKAQRFRSREQNREDALRRLQELVSRGVRVPRRRIPTAPGRAAREKRIQEKKHRGRLKSARSRRPDTDQ